jgi:transporter family protein
VPVVDFETHLYLILKAVIVLSSWLFAYFAMKHLPITLASPIKATQARVGGACGVLIFGEKLNGYQTAGVVVTLCSFFIFFVCRKKEGFSLRSSKWNWFIILATLTGAVSGLYDKYLRHRFDHMAVQTYYTFYQALIMALIYSVFVGFPPAKKTTPFQFRWSIALISVISCVGRFAYFMRLQCPIR